MGITSPPVSFGSAAADRGPSASTPSHDWFTVAWPLAILFHLAGNSDYLALFLEGSVVAIAVVQIMVIGAALAMLARPSPPTAVVLASGFVLLTWFKAPRVGNHEVILALACLLVAASAIRADHGWLKMLMPAMRWTFIIAYGSIAFSKLNTGFLDPAVSCAVVFGDEMGEWVHLQVSGNPALSWLVIVATVVIELAIPIMLVLRRFRVYGVVLGLVFHLGLALDPASHVFDFTSTLYPMFLAFMPMGYQHRLSGLVDEVRRRSAPWSVATGGAVIVGLHALVILWDWPRWLVAYPIWLALSLAVLLSALRYVAEQRRTGSARQADRINARVAWPLGLVVALAAVNGAAPYLEVRTAAAFNMYANLETAQGRSNHLLIRRTWPVRSTDLAVIGRAPDDHPMAYYTGRDVAVPLDNLRHYQRRSHGSAPSIGDDQVMLEPVFGGVEPIPGNLAELRPADGGWLGIVGHKLGFRRSVDLQDPTRCQREWGPAG